MPKQINELPTAATWSDDRLFLTQSAGGLTEAQAGAVVLERMLSVSETTNLDALTESGWRSYTNTATGAPSALGGAVRHVESTPQTAYQIAVDTAGQTYVRHRIDSTPTWNAWSSLAALDKANTFTELQAIEGTEPRLRLTDTDTNNSFDLTTDVTSAFLFNDSGPFYFRRSDSADVEVYARHGGVDHLLWHNAIADATLANDGVQKLPNGFIMQWQRINLTVAQGNEATVDYTLPEAFPNAHYASFLSSVAGSTAGSAAQEGVAIVGQTLTNVSVRYSWSSTLAGQFANILSIGS